MHLLAMMISISFTMIFGSVNLQLPQATEEISTASECTHGVEQAVYAERVAGGYNHTYIGSNGETKVCAVTVIEMGYYRKCPECGEIKGYMQTGTRESHSNPSHT